MNKKAVQKLYNSITNVKDEYIEEFTYATQETKSPPRFPFRLSYILAAVLLALALMGAGVITVIYGNSIQDWFEHYWELVIGESMNTEQVGIIDSLSQKIGISQTVGEVKITVDSATVGDDNFFLLLRVEGVQASKRKNYKFDDIYIEVSPAPLDTAEGIAGWGFQYLGIDGDGALLMLLDYNYATENNIVGEQNLFEVTLQLNNLIQSTHTNSRKLLTEGQWSFHFVLDYSQSLESLYLADAEVVISDYINEKNITVLLTDIELTNTGIKFKYVRSGAIAFSADMYVVLKNGLVVYCNDGASVPTTESTWNCSYQWTVPVNLADIAAIQIGNTEIPVDISTELNVTTTN